MSRRMIRDNIFEIAANARAVEGKRDGHIRSRYFEEDLLTDLVAFQLSHDAALTQAWVAASTDAPPLEGSYSVRTQVSAPDGLGSIDMVIESPTHYLIYEHKIDASITKNSEGRDQLSRYLQVCDAKQSERKSRVVLVARGLKKVEPDVLGHSAFMQAEGGRHHLWDDFVKCLESLPPVGDALLLNMRQQLLAFFHRYPGMRRERMVEKGSVTFDGILFDDWTYEEAHYESVKLLFAATDAALNDAYPLLRARGNKLGVTRDVDAGAANAEAREVSHYRFCRSGFSTIPAEVAQALSSPIFEIQMNIADTAVREASAERLRAELRGAEDCVVALGKGTSEKQIRLMMSLAEEVRELDPDLKPQDKLRELG
ncbi:MAG: PD-(D/E)XK nuclease family protein, partial [Planctomycetes bacterium]|nr:PD-(D/E)XK nuclease family protein [Planctomycetota bacterium]